MEVIQKPSPNFWSGGDPKKGIVIHHTGGAFEPSLNWLIKKGSGASAHYIVRKDGYVVQMVKETDRAWHAGISWIGNKPCVKRANGTVIYLPEAKMAKIVLDNRNVNPNFYMIGIEVESSGETFTNEQYASLNELITGIIQRNTLIKRDRYCIIGHYEVNPVDKPSDPKGCDFNRLISYNPVITQKFELEKRINASGKYDLYMVKVEGNQFGVGKIKVTGEGTSWNLNYYHNADKIVVTNLREDIYTVECNGVIKTFDNRPQINWEQKYKDFKIKVTQKANELLSMS